MAIEIIRLEKTTTLQGLTDDEVREKFLHFVMKGTKAVRNADGSECWVWQRFVNEWGYPKAKWGFKGISNYLVHRFVAELINGDNIEGKTVHHKCANRKCLNPDHLETITNRENLAEMMERSFYKKYIKSLENLLTECLDHLPGTQQQRALELLAVGA